MDRAVNSARLILFLDLNHIRLECKVLDFFAGKLIQNANLHLDNYIRIHDVDSYILRYSSQSLSLSKEFTKT